MNNSKNISEILVSKNIKPSLQRMLIYAFLIENRIHPTVDIIYKELLSKIPTLSKTTVYNTLKILIDAGLVVEVKIENNEVRYDATTDVHGHFKCSECGELFDFEFNPETIELKEIQDFKIDKTDLYLKGICKNCS